jgi:quercetin dioxygenase-like cupin family protein
MTTSTPSYAVLFPMDQDTTPPSAGIYSRTVHSADSGLRVVMFGMAPGEELSEHTAARPAIVEVLAGALEFRLGNETVSAPAGTWVQMDAGLVHAVRALTAAVMRLTLLPAIASSSGSPAQPDGSSP